MSRTPHVQTVGTHRGVNQAVSGARGERLARLAAEAGDPETSRATPWLSYARRVRLVERGHALEVLEERAQHAGSGLGSAAMVAGEAGIGKTVLLRELADRVRGRVPPLWGMCDSLSTPRPLGPLRDVAADLGASVSPMLRNGAAQHEIFAEVLDALRTTPRLLVVEDLHWADEATLDLVRFLARRIEALPLLLVVSYRDDLDAGHPLWPVIGDLVASPSARRLQLAPLSSDGVAELLGGHPLDAADIHRRTGGNPFFVSQILAQPDSPLPATVRDAVLARTAALAPAERQCLEVLSCTPEPVSGDLLGALAVTTATVNTLTSTGLVERRGHAITFRHEIVRSVVLAAATPGSEPRLHAAMIEALEAVGGDSSVLAHHAVAAGDARRILQYAPAAAGDAARSGSHREAIALYETALRFVGGDAALRASLLQELATELYLANRLDDAIAAGERALMLQEGLGDAVAVGAAHRALSAFFWYAADRQSAERHNQAAMEILSAADDRRELGYAFANTAFLEAHGGRTTEALRAAGQAAGIAEELGRDPVLLATAAIGRGVARLIEGDLEGRPELEAASEVGREYGIDDLATTPMSNLCHLDVEYGRLTQAEDSMARALAISEDRGIPICTMWQLGVRARLRLLQGRWSEAEDDARSAASWGALPLGEIWPNYVLGLLRARRQASPENPHLDELWPLAKGLGNPGEILAAASALAEQAWITRCPDRRLEEAVIAEMLGVVSSDQDPLTSPLRRWVRRLAEAGVQDLQLEGGGAEDPQVHIDQPFERAMDLWDSGSTDNLLAALRVLSALEAPAVEALFRARLRAAGVNSVPRGQLASTRANPAGLTARQLDVLALLAEGLSSADIAARLVISRKTTDHHVSAILAKLGVRSRGEAAAAFRRLPLGQ
jgi:DNA-binding CsgD family transcriptional regulator/tetratricopeptide (TPR) repeat protein